MSQNFHDTNLPDFMEIYAQGVSKFSTSCAMTLSGRENRSSDITFPRRFYNLKNCRLSESQFEIFNSFFIARFGSRYSFRLKDYFDHKAINEQFTDSDVQRGSRVQLKKTYNDVVSSVLRKITKPKKNTIKFWFNGVQVDAWEADYTTGIVTFLKEVPKKTIITSSYEFDVPVRFANDSFQYSVNSDGTISILDTGLLEVFE